MVMAVWIQQLCLKRLLHGNKGFGAVLKALIWVHWFVVSLTSINKDEINRVLLRYDSRTR
jgi:hypothetical protein